MNKHGKIPRRKRKSFYTNSYSKIRVKEDLIADKLQVGFIVRGSQSESRAVLDLRARFR